MKTRGFVVVLLSVLAHGCSDGSISLPTAASSPFDPRPVVIGDTVRARLTDADPLCDPSYPPTRCATYALTIPRDGSVEVAITWAAVTHVGDAPGFAVIDPTGRYWYPTGTGVASSVRLPAARRDFFRISVWSPPGEDFEIRTLLY